MGNMMRSKVLAGKYTLLQRANGLLGARIRPIAHCL